MLKKNCFEAKMEVFSYTMVDPQVVPLDQLQFGLAVNFNFNLVTKLRKTSKSAKSSFGHLIKQWTFTLHRTFEKKLNQSWRFILLLTWKISYLNPIKKCQIKCTQNVFFLNKYIFMNENYLQLISVCKQYVWNNSML